MLFEIVGMFYIVVMLFYYSINIEKLFYEKYGGKKPSALGKDKKSGEYNDEIIEMLLFAALVIFINVFTLVMMLWSSGKIPVVTYYFIFLMVMVVIAFMKKSKDKVIRKEPATWQKIY